MSNKFVLLSFWISLSTAIIVALLLRTFVFSVSSVPTTSMVPALYPGDYVVLNHWVYRDRLPKRGEIVVYTKIDQPGVFFVKRVVATSNESIEIKNGFILVDDLEAEYGPVEPTQLRLEKIPHTYRWHWVFWPHGKDLNYAQRTVADGSIFVLTDRRIEENSSVPWDTVPLPRVKAKVEMILFSTRSGWDRVLKSVY